jgi:4-amino-4-deoxy-L-arabinose transferase-like glycosyltransferase
VRRRDILLLCVVFVGPHALRRWEGGLPSDSVIYAAIARTMVDTGDWVDIRFGDEPHLKKPPLLFWLSALGMTLWGTDGTGARILPILCMLALACAVYLALDGLGYRRAGFWTAAILLVTRGFIRNSHLRMEPIICLLTACAVLGAVRARKQPWMLCSIGLAAGFGVLTKSVAGFWPLLAGLPAAVLLGPPRALRRPAFWLGLLGGTLVALPWYLAISLRHGPVFWNQFLGTQIWQRLSAEGGEFLYKPPTFYLGSFALNFLPGLPLLLGAAVQGLRGRLGMPRRLGTFLIIWTALAAAIPLVPRTKYARYLLHLYLPLGIYCGFFLASILPAAAEDTLKRRLRAGLVTAYLVLACLPVSIRGRDRTGVTELAPVFRQYAGRGYQTFLYKHKLSRTKAALIVYAGIYPHRIEEGADLDAIPRSLVVSREALPGRTPLVRSEHYRVYVAGRDPGGRTSGPGGG